MGAAVKLTLAAFPEDTARRIVMISDGNENRGNLLEQALIAKSLGVQVNVLPIDYFYDREVLVEKVSIPPDVKKGERVNINVVIRASEPTRGTLQILQKANNSTAPAPGDEDPVPIELQRGVNVLQRRQLITESNFYTFSAEFNPEKGSGDRRAINNKAMGFTHARGKGQVLMIEGTAGEHAELVKALQREADRGPGPDRPPDRRLGRCRRRPAADRPGPAPALRRRDPGQRPQGSVHREPAPAPGLQLPRHGRRADHARRPGQLRGRRLDEHPGREGPAGRHADQGPEGPGHRRHGPDHARQRDRRGELLAEGGGQGRHQLALELRLCRHAPLGGSGSLALQPAGDRHRPVQHAPRRRPDDARRHARLRPLAPDGHEGAQQRQGRDEQAHRGHQRRRPDPAQRPRHQPARPPARSR